MTHKKSLKWLSLAACLGSSLTFAPAAFAADTWNWNVSGCSLSSGTSSGMGNAYGCTSTVGGKTATITAWSTTGYNGSGSDFDKASLRRYASNTEFGVVNDTGETSTDSQHAIDNKNHTDAVLIQFSGSVELNGLNLGWMYNDSDISILRYVGNGDASAALLGKTAAQIKTDMDNGGDGWDLVANKFNVGTSAAATFNNANAVGSNESSSWWLITAYNQTIGTTTADSKLDYFKLFSFAAASKTQTPGTGVPEPATLTLAAAALGAIGWVRRRRDQA
ncbi:PEP-CTERM sorting domain-containing protein [Roseateles sp. DAIF2]|uniref:exosortase-dependent surface protein XDP1 n=1 Tax=Roseateles sp. DAIF2 TaxID=2714952 RepID=UPI0018A2B0C2|nr:exosortase-dependent surface protein XDP1 [Roseateles sp. DAIF2]QPF73540.1 PEP-CTERM sorting domain-containing protein [Roseateles sp. DAIF2]